MGTSLTTYFRSETFAGVKNNSISFFLLISYEVVPRDFYISSPDAAAWILRQVSIKVEGKSYLRTDCI